MPAVHVRDVDDAVLAALKQRAQRNRRSLQGELRIILEAAAAETDTEQPGRALRLKTVRVGAPTDYSRADIYDDGG